MKLRNWFQQRPNGTAVIAILLGFMIAGFGSLDAADRMALGLGSLIFYFMDSPYLLHTKELVFVLIGLGLCLPALGWTSKQKKGAIWWPGWIVLPFIPFGWVVAVFIGRPIVKVLFFGRSMTVPPDDEGIFDPKHWRGFRQSICWAGIIAIAGIIVLAYTIQDYPDTLLWVRIAHVSIPYIVGGFLLYGALRK